MELQPGDYVSTEGMTDDEYHAVCRAFIEAGACETYCHYGAKTIIWDKTDNKIWFSGFESFDFYPDLEPQVSRELTKDQILGAQK